MQRRRPRQRRRREPARLREENASLKTSLFTCHGRRQNRLVLSLRSLPKQENVVRYYIRVNLASPVKLLAERGSCDDGLHYS